VIFVKSAFGVASISQNTGSSQNKTGNVRINVILKSVRREKAICNTYSECDFVTVVIQNAIACAVSYMPSAACLTYNILLHYPINETILLNKVIEHTMCF
jgi:hypothetical protein